jgi:hypothetical protein
VINPTKASGPDLINPRLLKEAASIIKHPLCKLFNLSLRVASYILNKFALSISSNIKLPLWRIGGILISDPFIPEICLTIFHQLLQEEFMFVI